jgi:hypothetical protein
MDTLLTSVIQHLFAKIGESDAGYQIHLGQICNVPHWVKTGVTRFMVREAPMSAAEMHVIGLELAAKICALRERNRNDVVQILHHNAQRALHDSWEPDCDCGSCVYGRQETGSDSDNPEAVRDITYESVQPEIEKEMKEMCSKRQ